MKQAQALAVVLAAIWLLFGIFAELFIAWYSGVEIDIGFRAGLALAMQATVNVAAAVLAWRAVRRPMTAPTS